MLILDCGRVEAILDNRGKVAPTQARIAGLLRLLSPSAQFVFPSRRQRCCARHDKKWPCSVHELSIINGVITAVAESLSGRRVSRVYSVRLQLGALSGVVEDALQFSYGIATEGTILQGSRLDVERVPVVIHCAGCNQDVELPGIQSFRCPVCGAASMDIRRGRELEIQSLEIEEDE